MRHEFMTSSDELVQLWLHESCRIFKDRLVDDKDRSNFIN